MDKNDLPTDADIAMQVDAFSEKYLAPMISAAGENHEDGLVISLALIQKSFEKLRLTMHTQAGAIELFEELAATHVRNWKAESPNSSRPSVP